MKTLKSAPEIDFNDMRQAIDNICEYFFKESNEKQLKARVYMYRTRLGMHQNKVANIFGLSVLEVNAIAMTLGNRKTKEIREIENAIMDIYPKYIRDRFVKHLEEITLRMKKSTKFALLPTQAFF